MRNWLNIFMILYRRFDMQSDIKLKILQSENEGEYDYFSIYYMVCGKTSNKNILRYFLNLRKLYFEIKTLV